MATNKQYFSELIAKTFSKKNLIFVGIVFSVLFLSGCNGAGGTPGANGGGQDIAIKIVHGIMQIAGALLGVLTALVTILTHPGWYNGEFFGMQGYFKDIWILVSNVVYFAFAFILIRLAFMNIIGKGEGDFELKQALPRFVIGILIVPFSWFFVQFILSLSSILMVALMSLPHDIFKDKALFTGADTDNICKEFSIDLGSPISKVGNDGGGGQWFDCKGPKTSIRKIFDSDKGVYSLIGTYTYGILKLDQLNKFQTELSTSGAIRTVTDLTIKAIFDLLFIIVYFVLMMALFIALLVRGVQIWLYIMFSPIFGLQYFFKKDDAGELEAFNFMEFVKVAFVPALVGAALSFGLVFILVVNQGMGKTTPTSTGNMINCQQSNSICTIEVGEFKFTVKGAVGTGVGFVQEGAQIGLGALGTIMMNLFGLAVLWMAVMTALTNGGKMVNQVIEPIHTFGKEMGKLAMTSPQYLPILPGGLTPAGLPDVGRKIQHEVRNTSTQRSDEFLKKAGLDTSHNQLVNKMREDITLNQVQREERDATLTRLGGYMKGLGRPDELVRIKEFKDALGQALTRHNVPDAPTLIQGLGSEEGIAKALNALNQTDPRRTLGTGVITKDKLIDLTKGGRVDDGAIPPSNPVSSQIINFNLTGVAPASQNMTIVTDSTSGIRSISGVTGATIDSSGIASPQFAAHIASILGPSTSEADLRSMLKSNFALDDTKANAIITLIKGTTSFQGATPVKTITP